MMDNVRVDRWATGASCVLSSFPYITALNCVADGPVISQSDLYLLKPNLQIHPILTKSHSFILIFNLLTGASTTLADHILYADSYRLAKVIRGDLTSSKPTAITHSMRRTSLQHFPVYPSFISSRNVHHGARRYATNQASHLATYAGRCIRSE